LIEAQPLAWFTAKDNILCNRKGLNQHEVLMHHTNAMFDCGVRAVDMNEITV
jgi:hypothetical protein